MPVGTVNDNVYSANGASVYRTGRVGQDNLWGLKWKGEGGLTCDVDDLRCGCQEIGQQAPVGC